MDVEITLDLNDWEAYRIYCERELPKRISHWCDHRAVRAGLSLALVGIVTAFLLSSRSFDWPSAMATAGVLLLGFLYIVLYTEKVKRAYQPSADGAFIGRHVFHFDADKIISEGPGYRAEHDWRRISRVERGGGLVIIFLDTAIAMIFPEHQLPDADGFYNEVLRLHQAARISNNREKD